MKRFAQPTVEARWEQRARTLLAAMLLTVAAGCGRPPGVTGPIIHPLTGEVLEVDRQKSVLMVKHEAIPGFMPAMDMEFPVSAVELAPLQPGQRIRAELVVEDLSKGVYRLQKIWPDDVATRNALETAARSLRQDTTIRGKGAYREVGEPMPEFALLDHNGKVFPSNRLRGKQVMVNFFYTTCPLPDMCPLAIQNMMTTQDLARAAGIGDLELISISFDSADTPAVLKNYAEGRGVDTTNYTLLNSPGVAIDDLMKQFGIQFRDSERRLHTLATLLIDANGRIVHRVDGSQWSPADFVARMKK